jgi:hypothetical protein
LRYCLACSRLGQQTVMPASTQIQTMRRASGTIVCATFALPARPPPFSSADVSQRDISNYERMVDGPPVGMARKPGSGGTNQPSRQRLNEACETSACPILFGHLTELKPFLRAGVLFQNPGRQDAGPRDAHHLKRHVSRR